MPGVGQHKYQYLPSRTLYPQPYPPRQGGDREPERKYFAHRFPFCHEVEKGSGDEDNCAYPYRIGHLAPAGLCLLQPGTLVPGVSEHN